MTRISPCARAPLDRGESLIEILASITILGIALAALLGGVRQSVASSLLDRRYSDAQVYLTKLSDALPAAAYVPCATSITLPTPNSLVALPSGVTAAYDPAMKYWDTTTSAWVASCSSDSGVEAVRVVVSATVSGQPAVQRSIWLTLRNKCATLPC
jgi:type II secretory pathway pseudopilin PulG